MNLAFGRNVNDNIVKQGGMTTQAMTFRESPFAFFKPGLGNAERRQIFGIRGESVFWKVPGHTLDSATATKTSTTTNRVYVNA
jgi:hypothetical protein